MFCLRMKGLLIFFSDTSLESFFAAHVKISNLAMIEMQIMFHKNNSMHNLYRMTFCITIVTSSIG